MHVDVRLGRIERHAGTARSGGKGGMFPPGVPLVVRCTRQPATWVGVSKVSSLVCRAQSTRTTRRAPGLKVDRTHAAPAWWSRCPIPIPNYPVTWLRRVRCTGLAAWPILPASIPG